MTISVSDSAEEDVDQFDDANICIYFNISKPVRNHRMDFSTISAAVVLCVCCLLTLAKGRSPESCSEVQNLWEIDEGVFDIYSPRSRKQSKLYCDLYHDGGRWTVFQRRMDGSQNFEMNWYGYARGFGNLYGEFWMGLDALHRWTSQGRYELRIDLVDWDGNARYARYSSFSVGSASDRYRLRVGGYSGNAGDSLAYHNGAFFSTADSDNDGAGDENCAAHHGGGWWFSNCDESNLNSFYRDKDFSGDYGIEWHHFRSKYSMRFAEMKFRPRT